MYIIKVYNGGDMPENNQDGLPAAIWLVPAVALLIALAPLPYGYYTLLRIIICGAAAFIAYSIYQRQQAVSLWVLAMSGLVCSNSHKMMYRGKLWLSAEV